MFEKGLTTPEVQLISGHRDARMLFRYAHADRTTIAAKLTASRLVALLPPPSVIGVTHD